MTHRVVECFEELPARFIGGESPGRASGRFRINAGGVTRDVVVSGNICSLEDPAGKPDTEIFVTPEAWLAINEGRLSGIEAFAQKRLYVRGSIEKALRFDPLFDRPDAGRMNYQVRTVNTGRATISCIAAGRRDAPPLLLLHGLGGTKSSWATVVPALAERYRVYVLDLPGFGASSKPWGSYDAGWFASHVFSFMDALCIKSAHIAGNSMGGRIALEMGMLAPERVEAIACLCPATAFSKRPWLRMARLARAELGIAVLALPRTTLREELKSLFANPARIREEWYDAAIDDFLNVWKSPRARMAFFSAARRIYLDEPYGENGFWARLSKMRPPVMCIFGDHDVLISHRFAHRVRKSLPGAKVAVWKDCGHVPQLEHPTRSAKAMLAFFEKSKTVIDLDKDAPARVLRLSR